MNTNDISDEEVEDMFSEKNKTQTVSTTDEQSTMDVSGNDNAIFLMPLELPPKQKLIIPGPPFICTECNSSFNKLGTLRNHMRRHSIDKLFICDVSSTNNLFYFSSFYKIYFNFILEMWKEISNT